MGRTVKSQSRTALLLGAGYVARAMIPALRARGYAVFATTRYASNMPSIAALGAKPLLFDSAETQDALQNAELVLSSAPPNNGRDPVVAAFPEFFSRSKPHLKWAGYLSATSVYGDRNGQWAFEDELLKPATQRGRNRVEAELDWMESGVPVHVFRLAGIYGPGRSPFSKIRNGTARAVIKPGHVVNRVHVDDIVSALLASLDNPAPMRAYNIADDTPAPPQDVLDFAAGLLGGKPPPHLPLETADISDMARTFYAETKRISNARAKATFGWQPQYPGYKSGLEAVLRAEP